VIYSPVPSAESGALAAFSARSRFWTIRELKAQVLQRTLDPIVTPTAILIGHADNQSFNVRVCPGPPEFPLVTSLVFDGDQFAMPRQQSFGRNESCNLV